MTRRHLVGGDRGQSSELKRDRHRSLVSSSHAGSGGFQVEPTQAPRPRRRQSTNHRRGVPSRWRGRADKTGASELGQKAALGRERAQTPRRGGGRRHRCPRRRMVAQQLPDHFGWRQTWSKAIAIVNEALFDAGPLCVRDLLEPPEVHGRRLGIAGPAGRAFAGRGSCRANRSPPQAPDERPAFRGQARPRSSVAESAATASRPAPRPRVAAEGRTATGALTESSDSMAPRWRPATRLDELLAAARSSAGAVLAVVAREVEIRQVD